MRTLMSLLLVGLTATATTAATDNPKKTELERASETWGTLHFGDVATLGRFSCNLVEEEGGTEVFIGGPESHRMKSLQLEGGFLAVHAVGDRPSLRLGGMELKIVDSGGVVQVDPNAPGHPRAISGDARKVFFSFDPANSQPIEVLGSPVAFTDTRVMLRGREDFAVMPGSISGVFEFQLHNASLSDLTFAIGPGDKVTVVSKRAPSSDWILDLGERQYSIEKGAFPVASITGPTNSVELDQLKASSDHWTATTVAFDRQDGRQRIELRNVALREPEILHRDGDNWRIVRGVTSLELGAMEIAPTFESILQVRDVKLVTELSVVLAAVSHPDAEANELLPTGSPSLPFISVGALRDFLSGLAFAEDSPGSQYFAKLSGSRDVLDSVKWTEITGVGVAAGGAPTVILAVEGPFAEDAASLLDALLLRALPGSDGATTMMSNYLGPTWAFPLAWQSPGIGWRSTVAGARGGPDEQAIPRLTLLLTNPYVLDPTTMRRLSPASRELSTMGLPFESVTASANSALLVREAFARLLAHSAVPPSTTRDGILREVVARNRSLRWTLGHAQGYIAALNSAEAKTFMQVHNDVEERRRLVLERVARHNDKQLRYSLDSQRMAAEATADLMLRISIPSDSPMTSYETHGMSFPTDRNWTTEYAESQVDWKATTREAIVAKLKELAKPLIDRVRDGDPQ